MLADITGRCKASVQKILMYVCMCVTSVNVMKLLPDTQNLAMICINVH